MKTLLKLVALTLVLNVVRYTVGFPLEQWLIFDGMAGVMQNDVSYFNSGFTTTDWITSYFYNFTMWFVSVVLFHLLRPVLSGHDVVRSLKVFGLCFLFFASVSAIYMNHYSHSRLFYAYSIADALVVYTLVGTANGLCYRYFFKFEV